MIKLLCASAAVALAAVSAQAATTKVTPVAYNMPNGNSGKYNYWDDLYTGTGSKTTNNATLTGGVGDLTDGIIATRIWDDVEGPSGSNGPYVGWVGLNPEIRFIFDQVYDFVSITFHFDDSNGFGGVNPPSAVTAANVAAAVTDTADPAPFAFKMDITGYTEDVLDVQVFRQGTSWIFLSEVEFEVEMAPAIPVPAGLPLLVGGLGALALLRRRAS